MMVMWFVLYVVSVCVNCVLLVGVGGRYSVSLFFWLVV